MLQLFEHRLDDALVADKVVVDDVDPASVSAFVERVEFGDELLGCFVAWDAAVKFDDVAELAVEGAAARELDADVYVVGKIDQVESRDRRGGYVGSIEGRELAVGLSFAPAL